MESDSFHVSDPCRILVVDGDHRVAILTKRDMEAGDEIFYDYKYDKRVSQGQITGYRLFYCHAMDDLELMPTDPWAACPAWLGCICVYRLFLFTHYRAVCAAMPRCFPSAWRYQTLSDKPCLLPNMFDRCKTWQVA